MDNNNLEHFFGTNKTLNEFGKYLEDLANEQCLKKERNDQVKKDVVEIFRSFYQGQFRVVLYGSRISGLATTDSADLDFLIDTSDENMVPINNGEVENWMLNKAVSCMGSNWTNIEKIFCCRRPILKAVHKATQMHCDITVMSNLGVSNTQMMSLYMKHIPLLRQMILVVREWAGRFQFTKDVNNYGLGLMVLFYMQIKGYTCSVSDLRFEIMQSNTDITGYDYVYYDCIDNINRENIFKDGNEFNLNDLLLGFFKYYSIFDYNNDLICPLIGYPLKKKFFENKHLKKLPPEMYNYVQIVKNGGEAMKITEMVLQDPIDLSHNVTKKARKNFVPTFKGNCSRVATLLKTI